MRLVVDVLTSASVYQHARLHEQVLAEKKKRVRC